MSWWIPFGAGLEDGINPCVLMTCAAMLGLRLWLERKGLKPEKFLGFFIAYVFAFNLALTMGVGAKFLSTPVFHKIAVVGGLALAAVFLAVGAVFFYDWMTGTIANISGPDYRGNRERQKARSWVLYLGIGVLGLLMSVAGSIWAADYNIIILSNNLLMPGRFWGTAGILAVYTLVQLWPAILLAVLFAWGQMTARLRQVITSAVFLSAAVGVIYVYGR